MKAEWDLKRIFDKMLPLAGSEYLLDVQLDTIWDTDLCMWSMVITISNNGIQIMKEGLYVDQ